MNTIQTILAGRYDWRRVLGYVLGAAGVLTAMAQAADRLPPSLQPVLGVVGPWADAIAIVVGGVLVRAGLPVVVRSSESEDA